MSAPKPLTHPFLAPVLAAAVLTAVTLLAYRGIELNGFHFDDWHNILLNPAVQLDRLTLAGLLDAARGASLPHRPLPSVTFALDWWRGGDRAAPFLGTNLALHVLTALAVFALLRRTLRAATAERPLAATLAAGLAATWWAVQPIQVQAVSYVVQRMTELAALFSILCVFAYLRGREAAGWHRAGWGLLALASFVAAVLSKQNAWITPALVLMAEFLVLRHGAQLVQRRSDHWLLATPLAATVVVGIALSVDGPVSEWIFRGYAWRDFTLAERLLTQPKVVLFHVSQLLWPQPDRFSLEHHVEVVRSAAAWQFWLPLTAIVAWCTAGGCLAARPGTRTAGFFILWLPVTLLIESSFIPLEMVFEHRMYLPSVGFAGLIAIGLATSPAWPRPLAILAWVVIAAATLFAAWATNQRLPQWRTEISLLENSVRHAPDSVRVWNQLGIEYLEHGQLDLARRAIERANEIEPRWGDGYPFVNRGVVLEAMGRTELALAVYEETIRLFPRQVLGYNNRGLLHLRAGRIDLARQDFDRAIAVKPDYAPAWTNRGTAHFFKGDSSSARADFEMAVSLSPRESVAFHYLARIHAAAGRAAEAAAARDRACRLGVAKDCAP